MSRGVVALHETRAIRKTSARVVAAIGGAALAAGIGVGLWLSGTSHTPKTENNPASIVTSAIEASAPNNPANIKSIGMIGCAALVIGSGLAFASRAKRRSERDTGYTPGSDFVPGLQPWLPEPADPDTRFTVAEETIADIDRRLGMPPIYVISDPLSTDGGRRTFDWHNDQTIFDPLAEGTNGKGAYWKRSEGDVFAKHVPVTADLLF